MERRELVQGFVGLADGAGIRIHNNINLVYNPLAGFYNELYGARGWFKSYIHDAFSWAPWPVSEALDWLANMLADWVVDPLYGVALQVAHYPIAAMDLMWNDDRGRWGPGVTVEDFLQGIGSIVMWIYDNIVDEDGAIHQMITGLLTTARLAVDALILPLWTGLTSVWDYINTTIAASFTALTTSVNGIRDTLDAINTWWLAVTADPGQYVWDVLEATLLERVRTFLLRVW